MSQAVPLLRIRASAGSGKTYALTRKYLDLLRRADPDDAPRATRQRSVPHAHAWPEILAVTFTNRAALEMKERIIRSLKTMALGHERTPPEGWTPELAASWLTRIMRRYGCLNVRTIDSLLHMVVRLGALELGLAPDFQPVFDERAALAPLLDDVLERSRTDDRLGRELHEACSAMLLHSPDKGFLLGSRLRDKVLPLILLMSSAEGEPAAAAAVSNRLEDLGRAVREAAACLQAAAGEEELPLSRFALWALQDCLHCSGMLEEKAMLGKASLDDWLLASGKGRASSAAQDCFRRLRRAVDAVFAEGNLLHASLRTLPFARLAWRASRELPDFLQGQAALPADLVPGLVQHILHHGHGVSAAFCRMGSTLTHILIDEFQDTSREQWQALLPLAVEALSRGGSLTWVGDVKQAIYAWRGGDHRLFDELTGHPDLLEVAGQAHTDTLPTNHRSASNVVRANNSVFSRLADPATAQALLAGMLSSHTPQAVLESVAADVSATFKDAAQLESGKPGGFVRVERLQAADGEAARALLRGRVTNLIGSVLDRRPAGDIGILVRDNGQATLLAADLMEQGIPVVTENSLLLSEHPLIIQSLAFLEWLDAPLDELAFWTLVAGPVSLVPHAVDRQRLEDWLASRSRSEHLVRDFSRDFPDVWEPWLAPFQAQAGLLSPYDALREMSQRWSVWSRFPDAGPFLQRLLEIVHLTEQDGRTSVSSFLEHWREHGEGEKAPMPDAVDAVRIITIHKAKGLQFPVVIVAGHHFTVGRNAGGAVPAEVNGLRLFVQPGFVLGEPYYRTQAESARENLNLLYVAWTRAEEELYALIAEDPHTRRYPGLTRALPRLLDGLDTWDRHADGSLSFGKNPATDRIGIRPPAPDRSGPGAGLPEASSWTPMDWLPRLKVYRSEPDELFGPRQRGTFVHACLERVRLAEGLPQSESAEQIQGIAADIVASCRSRFPLPVPEEHLEPIRAALSWFLSRPETHRWMRDGLAEHPLLDEAGLMIRPDLIVPEYQSAGRDDASAWTVVEYKTGQPVPQHADQIRRYMRVLRDADACPVRGCLVYLDERRVVDLPAEGGS